MGGANPATLHASLLHPTHACATCMHAHDVAHIRTTSYFPLIRADAERVSHKVEKHRPHTAFHGGLLQSVFPTHAQVGGIERRQSRAVDSGEEVMQRLAVQTARQQVGPVAVRRVIPCGVHHTAAPHRRLQRVGVGVTVRGLGDDGEEDGLRGGRCQCEQQRTEDTVHRKKTREAEQQKEQSHRDTQPQTRLIGGGECTVAR